MLLLFRSACAKRRLRSLLWVLPLCSLALAFLACSLGPDDQIPRPPVTHLSAAQLQMEVRIGAQYSVGPDVEVAFRFFKAGTTTEVSLADEARLTCNGGDVKLMTSNYSGSRPCRRQPPGGAYHLVFTDEHGAATTVVVPVPSGSLAILSPRESSTVKIPTNGTLSVRFSIPILPPNSYVTQLDATAVCHAQSGATCDSIGNTYSLSMGAPRTPVAGIPVASSFENPVPPTPTPDTSVPTATAFPDRATPSPPEPSPTPYRQGAILSKSGDIVTIALAGGFTDYQPGSGAIQLDITTQIAPDRGGFDHASATMSGRVSANITWTR